MPGGVRFPSTMERFSNAREAKEFLVSGIVTEAQREHVSLSETERKMLYFSETGWTLPDMTEVNDKFDRECDQAQYEKKIAHLIRRAIARTRGENPEEAASWIGAIRKLKKEDHYISVMAEEAGVSTGSLTDNWKTAALLALFACAFVAFLLITYRLGLWLPRTGTGRGFGSYRINERLSNFVGYAWFCFAGLYLFALAYSHFDRKRRVYEALDRILVRVFRLFKLR
jgi:hypothetical protein